MVTQIKINTILHELKITILVLVSENVFIISDALVRDCD